MSKDSSVKTMNTIYYLLMMVARTLRLTIYKILLLTIAMLSFYHLVEISEKAAMIAGYQNSTDHDAVVMIDGDLQHPLNIYLKWLKDI